MDDISIQERTWMRERFIRMNINLKGRKATFNMHGNTTVKGTWQTTDGNFSNILINDLHTPRPETIPKAALRVDDIISIHIPL